MIGAFDAFLERAAMDCVNADHGQGMAPLPSSILLALVADLGDAARDLGHQSRAAADREEVLLKLDGIADLVSNYRAAYLVALERGR